jgi:hypothetical protein
MQPDAGPGGIIPEDELKQMADFYRQFEGAPTPLARECLEAESSFNRLVEQIFRERVKPAFAGITLVQFRSFSRNYSRKRVAKEQPPYPCP